MTRRRRKPTPFNFTPRLTVWAGEPAFSAWMVHFRATGLRNFAKFCEGQGYAQVPTRMPETIAEKRK